MNLSEKAMLVHLKISMSLFHVKDSAVSSNVKKALNASEDAGSWYTYLIPKRELDNIVKAAGKCRAVVDSMTLPWNDSGDRILPAEMYMKFTEKMRPALAEFDAEVDKFIARCPEIIARKTKRLGGLDSSKLPTISQIRSKFGYDVDISPMPTTQDFRVTMSDEDVSTIKNNMEKSISRKVEAAIASIWEELSVLVGKVEATLSEPDKIFRNTLITNLSDFCELIPKLNIVNDTSLEETRKQLIEKLANIHPETLRDNPTVRKEAAKSAKEALEKMKEYTSL